MPGRPPRRPPVARLEQRARAWLGDRARSPAGWQEVLEAAAVNLRHGFTSAVLAAAQLPRPEPVAAAADWEKAGWQPRPGGGEPVWLIRGHGLVRRTVPAWTAVHMAARPRR